MAKVGNISGTVSIGLDGHDTHSVATFEIPVTTTLDTQTGIAHLEAASSDAIRLATIQALIGAADQLLSSIPTADVEELDSTAEDDAHTATCDSCGTQLACNGPAELKHRGDGSHLVRLHHQ